MSRKYMYIIFSMILIYGCSEPQICPELIFDAEEKLTYVNGKVYTGRCLLVNNEIPRSIQQYINGIDHGNWIFYFENGKVETKGKFHKGKRIGVWKYYYPNGKIRQKSRYSNKGERKGNWTAYDSIGNLVSSKKY